MVIRSNMAGTVWKILVSAGDRIEVGQDVLILESMKMEIPISAVVAGCVKQVIVRENQFVNDGEILVELE